MQPFRIVTLGTLQRRLLLLVRHRIQNGEFTERGLARMLGISQPQVHNVLKGARKLQPDLADRMMLKLSITALQLLDVSELSGSDSSLSASDEHCRLRRLKKTSVTEISTPVRQKLG